jgi:hypothetical protein
VVAQLLAEGLDLPVGGQFCVGFGLGLGSHALRIIGSVGLSESGFRAVRVN